MDGLGKQERGERRQDDGHIAQEWVVHAAAHLHREPRGHRPGRGPADVGEQEQRGHMQHAEVLLAPGDAHRQGVDD